MFLMLSTTGGMVVIWIMLILSILIFGFGLFLDIRYVILVATDNNEKAETDLAYAGYYSILSMILLFCIQFWGFSKTPVSLEREYYGLFAMLAIIPLAPALIIFDFKQIRWIKSLNDKEREAKNISLRDRAPLIWVVTILALINIALIGVNIESFIFVFSGLL